LCRLQAARSDVVLAHRHRGRVVEVDDQAKVGRKQGKKPRR
jgi:hypothetical protein